jgi:hypothetical protein
MTYAGIVISDDAIFDADICSGCDRNPNFSIRYLTWSRLM